MNIGWLGLGAMGAPMAACVAAAGHTVTAFDVDDERASALADRGVLAATSGTQAATDADVLVVMVATAAQAEQALFGDPGRGTDGAHTSLRPGSTVLVMATVGIAPVVAWSNRLAERGVRLVDAPVSGGVRRAGLGDLLIMVGGTAEDVAEVEPLLAAMASTFRVVGPAAGDGQRVKLVNQLLCGVHVAAAAEGLAFAESLGLDPRACWEVIRHGAAASFMLDDRGERMTDPHPDQVNSALDIFVKDMALVVAAGTETGAWTPLARVAEQLYSDGSQAGLGRGDDSAVIELFRRARS